VDLAVAKILDSAGQAFVDLGVSRAGMGEIAHYSGCSRSTPDDFVSNLQGGRTVPGSMGFPNPRE